MARAFFKLNEANMRCTRFSGGINAGFRAQAANFYLCVHIGPNSRPLRFRHPELVLVA